jgi:hypothetical protein
VTSRSGELLAATLSSRERSRRGAGAAEEGLRPRFGAGRGVHEDER